MKIVHTADREIIPGSGCPYIPIKHRMTPKRKPVFSTKENFKTVRKDLFGGKDSLLSVTLPSVRFANRRKRIRRRHRTEKHFTS